MKTEFNPPLPIDIMTGAGLSQSTAKSLDAELIAARKFFPGNDQATVVLDEAHRRLKAALYNHSHTKSKGHMMEVRTSAIRVAVMAIRILEEGAKPYPYKGTRNDVV